MHLSAQPLLAAILLGMATSSGGGEPGPDVRTLEGHTSSVMALAFSSDGKVLVSSSRDKSIKFWNVQSGKAERTLTAHNDDVYAVVFSSKWDLLASGSGDKTIKLFDAATGKEIRTLTGHTEIVRSVAFSPDQQKLASVSVDRTVRLWDVKTGELLKTMNGHTHRVKSVVYSPDGQWIATAATDRTIRFWDVKSGKETAKLEGHTGDIETLALSPNGKFLASSSNDATVRLWDTTTFNSERTLQGHDSEVDSVGFSPNGETLASGSKDKTIKLWEVRTGKLLRTLTGHTGRVESLAFSPDGKTLATGGGGGDSSVRLWDLTKDRSVDVAGAVDEQKSESFDKDPGWESHNNRIVPKKRMMVKQDFGYSATQFAGKGKGEMGGVIQRSTTPAYYAAKIATKTLDDKLTASGSFAITACQPGAGVFFGFFNSQQPGGSGRPIGSLGLDFDFEGNGGRLAVRLITDGNKSCGTFITPYLPGKFRPTPLKKDGTKYHWTLDYDPLAGDGNGRFTFTMRSDTHTSQDYGSLPEKSEEEAHIRFPNTTTFTVDLTPGFRKEGATFDRFGALNLMKAGGSATMFFDDVEFNGETQDFAADPQWIGAGNRTTFEDREQVGAHDFGFSANTAHAGGQAGEVGGGLWRSGDYGYYADRVGPLDLKRRLEASGKVKLVVAGPDSDMFIGWFNSASKNQSPFDAGDFIGIHVGGPTRIGHYFNPSFAFANGARGKLDRGPILTPAKVFDWSLVYDPAANDGHGEMRVTLGKESVMLPLKPGQKNAPAKFDRFGLFTSTAGGQMVKIYLDDLKYTAASRDP
jgi:WD40 repeat protein